MKCRRLKRERIEKLEKVQLPITLLLRLAYTTELLKVNKRQENAFKLIKGPFLGNLIHYSSY